MLPLNEIERLERELRQLKEKYDKLYKENQNLKADDTRILKDVIERKKFNYLFSYDINETGKIVNGSEYIANTNFTKLYKCLLGTIKPYAKLERERYFLRIPNFSDLTQTEWTILRVLTERVLNEMVMAKIMIDDKETHTEDDVRHALEYAYDVRTPSTTQNAENKESVVETFQYDEEAIKHEQTVLGYIIINMGNILKAKSQKQLVDYVTFIHRPYQTIWDYILWSKHNFSYQKNTGEVRHMIYDSLPQELQNIWEDTVCKFHSHPAVATAEFESSREWLKQEHLMDLFRKKKHYHRDYEVYHEEEQ